MGFELLAYYFILLLLILCPILLQAQENSQQPCGSEVCGGVEIRSPFGINSSCYSYPWFNVTCHGEKPFLNMNGNDVEVRYLASDGVLINNPVSYVNCDDKSKGSAVSVNLTGTPFYFLSDLNYFGSVGCGSLVNIFDNEADDPVGGCIQPTCGGGGGGGDDFGSGCFTEISAGNLTWYTVNMTAMDLGDSSKKCALAFMVMRDNPSDSPLPYGINAQSTHVPAFLAINSTYCGAAGCSRPGSRKINFQKSCGNFTFQYPFGVNHQDHSNDWFGLICDKTNNTKPMPYLNINGINLQILDFSFVEGSFTVNYPITYTNCRENKNNGMSLNLRGTRYYYSRLDNVFWSSGCGNLVTVFDNEAGNVIGGCLQPRCSTTNSNGTSFVDGCQINIPQGLTSFYANMSDYRRKRSCGSAFMITSQLCYDQQATPEDFDISSRTYVPTRLQWGRPLFGLCNLHEGVDNTSCNSDRTQCWSKLSPTHLCYCSKDKNSDLSTYCEGENCRGYKWCHILCLNTPGNYCSSKSCPPNYEYKYNISGSTCERKITPPAQKNWRLTIIIIGCSTSLGTVVMVLATWKMYKLLQRRKNKMLKQKYFKRNGGLLLQQHLSGNSVEKIKLFTMREMGKATDYYNENRILGRGGQGTVYKGMLTDGSLVAIKKYMMMEGKKFDERKVEHFINEVVILSQINHRNVVKLLGCCLEAQVPLLVYEFIPNGTLYDLIHCPPDQEFKLTWEMRLRIAIEIANALFYLHSAASVPIYHRDIKSTNILLDDKYRAKVSDFGTSRSVTFEQTHLTTRVQGTFGYMDPEYFRSSQFTEKSDVYSFGVVLVELLTGQKPISSKETDEVRSLVSYFLLSMQENSLVDILDSVVNKDGVENEIIAVAKLARRCLNLIGKKRPTMKQVVLELEFIKASKEGYAIEEEESGDEESELEDPIESWDIIIPSCATTRSVGTDSVTLPLNASF